MEDSLSRNPCDSLMWSDLAGVGARVVPLESSHHMSWQTWSVSSLEGVREEVLSWSAICQEQLQRLKRRHRHDLEMWPGRNDEVAQRDAVAEKRNRPLIMFMLRQWPHGMCFECI